MDDDLRPCSDCDDGFFIKIQKPKSYDFNKDGWVPLSCNECGLCNDSESIAKVHTYSAAISNGFIKDNVLQPIFNEKVLQKDYTFKKELYKLLKKQVFFQVYDLAECIVSHCQGRGYLITRDYVLKAIYKDLDYSHYV